MREIVIYITTGGVEPMCEDPAIAQNVADQLNGPDSHCVKGDEDGQWLIEEPTLMDEHGIGKRLDVLDDDGFAMSVVVEDAYCFYAREMPVKFLDKLPKAVFEKLTMEVVNG